MESHEVRKNIWAFKASHTIETLFLYDKMM